ncbi:hypothetical protein PN416_17475, partial [Halorubrum ezzemoulense]|uniref:hypothetical protein n=1 Tax=Halorubrum ezzemoulense TaxID=337243 RepID=UPI00232B2AE3
FRDSWSPFCWVGCPHLDDSLLAGVLASIPTENLSGIWYTGWRPRATHLRWGLVPSQHGETTPSESGRSGGRPQPNGGIIVAGPAVRFPKMNTLLALVVFTVSFGTAIALLVGVVFAALLSMNARSGSEGCDFCSSESATRLGGGDVACSDCKRRVL